MDSLAINHEKLRVFCGSLHNQITEQNTVIKDLTQKMTELEEKISHLESKVTLSQFSLTTENDNDINELDCKDELELKLIEE